MSTHPHARTYTTPPGIVVGPLIPDGEARGYRLQTDAGWFDGFVVRRGEALHGYLDRCPHAGVALTARRQHYLTEDGARIGCHWHGAQFRIEDGACLAGPCGGLDLERWPIAVQDGSIVTI